MIGLLLTIALIGLIVWAIISYIPMAPGFKNAIVAVAIIGCILYVLAAFGVVADLPVPRLRP